MFKKILIANRGEIALRIMKTAKKMGIKTVAVYSEADSNSLYVSYADEAVFIGQSPSDKSYLVIDNIIDAIRQTGADAVHPGYGFLSENAEFARRIAEEGVAFIGPPLEAIRLMGDKIEAKKIAEKAKVNCVPGYIGQVEDIREALKNVNKIGLPVVIKAAAGGGGKGMRIVYEEEKIAWAFKSAAQEAKKSFNDERIFIEKYIESPRHIEIQILGDKQGNVVCLGERECSIQRHHQKVIEEAPSPFIDEKTRKKMYEQSVSLAKKVGYFSAGTIEYIVDKERNFYFLEMNTRLQVEHPVTEFITGLDLVEWMIRIANGEAFPKSQEDIKLKGWAVESRIYAEDPQRGFLPSSGRITDYKEPETSANVRVDSGVYAGGEVSMFYDAMIAKVITYGSTRIDAIKLMQEALGEFVITGVSHNIAFLEAIMTNKKFIDGNLSTKFIEEEYPGGFSGAELTEQKTKLFLSVGVFIFLKDAHRATTTSGQMKGRERQIPTRWVVSVDNVSYWVNVRKNQDGFEIRYEDNIFSIYSSWLLGYRLFKGTIDGKNISAKIEFLAGANYIIESGGSRVRVNVRTPRVAELETFMPKTKALELSPTLKAPISGVIIDIFVKKGEIIKKGQELLTLEAMKMQNILYSEIDGEITEIAVSKNQSVQVDDLLVEFKVGEFKVG
jgi:propionyl-CoA carboxylase alpha chain